MSGWPTRISRAALGPQFEERTKVSDPKKELGQTFFNLSCWQLAGLGVVSPKAWALFHWTGAAMVLDASAEAWDPDSAFVPTLARTSAGIYVVTYAATYPDQDGVQTPPALQWCVLHSQDAVLAPAQGVVSSSRIITTAIHKLSDNSAFDPAGVLLIAG